MSTQFSLALAGLSWGVPGGYGLAFAVELLVGYPITILATITCILFAVMTGALLGAAWGERVEG